MERVSLPGGFGAPEFPGFGHLFECGTAIPAIGRGWAPPEF